MSKAKEKKPRKRSLRGRIGKAWRTSVKSCKKACRTVGGWFRKSGRAVKTAPGYVGRGLKRAVQWTGAAAEAVLVLVLDLAAVVLLFITGVVLSLLGCLALGSLAAFLFLRKGAVATRELFSPASATVRKERPTTDADLSTVREESVPKETITDAEIQSWLRTHKSKVQAYLASLRKELQDNPADSVLVGSFATVQYWLQDPKAVLPERRNQTWAALHKQHGQSTGLVISEVQKGFYDEAEALYDWARGGIQPPRMAAA